MTSLIVFCSLLGLACLLIGIWIGGAWEHHAAMREERELQAGAEADEYVTELRPDPEYWERRAAMARRTHPVYRPRRTSTAAFLNPPERLDAAGYFRGVRRAIGPGTSVDPPRLELVESDAAWEARVFGDLDRFMGGLLGAYPAPAGDSQ